MRKSYITTSRTLGMDMRPKKPRGKALLCMWSRMKTAKLLKKQRFFKFSDFICRWTPIHRMRRMVLTIFKGDG